MNLNSFKQDYLNIISESDKRDLERIQTKIKEKYGVEISKIDILWILEASEGRGE
jgi:hypothetical protein